MRADDGATTEPPPAVGGGGWARCSWRRRRGCGQHLEDQLGAERPCTFIVGLLAFVPKPRRDISGWGEKVGEHLRYGRRLESRGCHVNTKRGRETRHRSITTGIPETTVLGLAFI